VGPIARDLDDFSTASGDHDPTGVITVTRAGRSDVLPCFGHFPPQVDFPFDVRAST
jgi:hypothetical protein